MANVSVAVCAICGREYSETALVDFCGKPFCSDCLDKETFVCAVCGDRMPRSELATYPADWINVCQSCYDEHYTHCAECGKLLRQSDVYWLALGTPTERPSCESCYKEHCK